MARLILLNKPYDVVCQFTPLAGHRSLEDFVDVPDVYPAGRLDTDSEGLVLLTDDGKLQHAISDPRHKWPKVYRVQVDGIPAETALEQLRAGVPLPEGVTRPAGARAIPEPEGLWPRKPPIRFRRLIPTAWIELTLTEGRYRQVRRMTAAVGFPTLRLVRWAVGPYTLEGLAPGEWRQVEAPAPPAAEPRAAGRMRRQHR